MWKSGTWCASSRAWLLATLLSVAAGEAWAQPVDARGSAREPNSDVALFVVGTEPAAPGAADGVLSALQAKLAREHRTVALPRLSAPRPAPNKAELTELRAIGQDALRELKDDSGADLLARYQGRIADALELTSSALAGDARALLWNLCVLRVQLLLRQQADAAAVEDGVRECRRRFVDQRELRSAWQPEVARAFEEHARGMQWVTLGVQSEPASCDVLLYGAVVGKTPLRIDVPRGPQEVRLRCGDRASLVHHVDVGRPLDLAVRMPGDAAFQGFHGSASVLTYPTPAGLHSAADHASAFALEAGAASWVTISSEGDAWRLDWGHVDAPGASSVRIRKDAAAPALQAALAGFRPPALVAASSRASGGHGARVERSGADIALGTSLLAAGVGSAVFPAWAFAQGGRCADGGDCEHMKQRGGDAAAWAVLGVSSALVASGVALLWRAPFGRRRARRETEIGLAYSGVSVRGTFP
jgi:hypothetical protein